MLKAMRANAGSWIIKFLLLAIVIVFVFWGVGSFNSQQTGRVAVVNGETISYDDFNKAYAGRVDMLKYQFGDKLDEDMLQMLNVKQQVINELVNNKLLAKEARRLNFDISKEELSQTIKAIPAFQTDDKFDPRRYQMILNAMRHSPEEFERLQKEAMLIDKLKTVVYAGVNVSDGEALEWYNHNQATVAVDYVLFQPETHTDIQPSEEEILTYFEENKENYKTQPMVKAQYLRFSPDAYKSRVSTDNEAIANYYSENMDSFLEPKTVEARHILIKIPQDALPEVVEEKRVQAENIMKMAQAGKDFAELANTHSEGPSNVNGGYLGTFNREQMIQPFSDAAFSMNPGDISAPVRTQFGWHIIKVENVNEEKQKTVDEASPEIQARLLQKEAEYLAYNDAEIAYDDSFDNDNLKNIAEAKGYQLWTTDFFTSNGPPDIFQAGKFADVAFSLETDEISNIETIGSDYFILQVVDQKPAEIPELESVKSLVVENLVKTIQDEKARKEAIALLALLTQKTPENSEQAVAPAFQTTGFFKRDGNIPELGNEKAVADAAFLLTEKNPYPENIVEGNKGYYVIRFKERKWPEMESFVLEKETLKKTLIQNKQVKAFNALVEQLRENADITLNETIG